VIATRSVAAEAVGVTLDPPTSWMAKSAWAVVLIACVAISIGRVFPQLLYPEHYVNEHDDANYVNDGRMLLHRQITSFGVSPLCSFFYAPIVHGCEDRGMWLFDAATTGHRVLFVLLWFVVALAAFHVRDMVPPVFLLAWPLLTPILFTLVQNSSDALFAVSSGITFVCLLRYCRTRSFMPLCLASFCLGLSSLARADGLVLGSIVFLIVVGFLRVNRVRLPIAIGTLAVTVLPQMSVVTGYLLIQHRCLGTSDMGIRDRTYYAFQQGQGAIYREMFKKGEPLILGEKWADQLYGTRDENRGSVLIAIKHNPGAFARRVARSIGRLPALYSSALGWPLLLFAVMGAVSLWRVSRRDVLLSLAWQLSLASYLVTFFRGGYLLLEVIPLIVLAGAGLHFAYRLFVSGVNRIQRLWTRRLVYGSMMGVGVYVVSSLVGRPLEDPKVYSGDREAIMRLVPAIERTVPGNAPIGSLILQLVYNAKRPAVCLTCDSDEESISRWIAANHVQAVLLDRRFKRQDPVRYKALVAYGATHMEAAYRQGDEMIFLAGTAR